MRGGYLVVNREENETNGLPARTRKESPYRHPTRFQSAYPRMRGRKIEHAGFAGVRTRRPLRCQTATDGTIYHTRMRSVTTGGRIG